MNIIDQALYQLNQFFGLDENEKKLVSKAADLAANNCLVSFSEIKQKYYNSIDSKEKLNGLHSGQNTCFLYYLSRELSNEGNLGDKVYYLNKALNGVDLYHQIELPAVFFVEHPVGSVLGRAQYSDRLVFQQGCTVGGNIQKNGDIVYPQLGEDVWLFANSTVIGDSNIGTNVYVAAQTFIKDENIPSNSIVFGQSPNLVIKSRDSSYFESRSLFK